jgi:hypothetical protein
VRIPGFIARQFYVEGSLQNTPNGFQLQAQNPMGSGVLTGVGQLRVDGREIDPSSVTAQREGDPAPMSARDVSPQNPVNVSKGDRVTLHVSGGQLSPGEHQLEVELTELNLGELSFSIADRISA